MTPEKWRPSAAEFIRDVDRSIGGYLRGQLLDCLLIGFLSFVAFAILGMKYPILLGIIIGVTNVIPYFGFGFGRHPRFGYRGDHLIKICPLCRHHCVRPAIY